MTELKVRGSYFEVGKQIGIAFKQKIREYIECRYFQMKSEMQELGYLFERKDYDVLAPNIVNYVRQNAIEEYQELEGIANVASVKISDIIFAIGYTDIFDLILKEKIEEASLIRHEINNECSTFVIEKDSSKIGGQNWDMDPISKENICIMKKEYSDGLKICAITTILGLVHMGMNNFGVCVGTANLSSKIVTTKGLIFPIVLQNILKTHSKVETLRRLSRYKFISGHYYYIMYPDGNPLLIETDSDNCIELQLNGEVFVHTNHYINKGLHQNSINYSVNSIERKKMLEQSLQKRENLTEQEIKVILADHEKGLCRHSCNNHSVETVASVIFKPKERRIDICDNAPCIGKWSSYNMNLIFKEDKK